MYSNKKIVQILGEILKSKSIFHIIISPGSRNAPIIIHFTQDEQFKTYSIVDERCAAFFALGISQMLQKPVIINCTSGSSVVNYYPAVTEAFYQNIPLIILTADRPKHMRNIFEGQSIFQENIFSKHVESSIQLTEEETKKGLEYDEKLLNESINKCIIYKKPIHINVPFSEPLYETTKRIYVNPKIIKLISVQTCLNKFNYYKKELSLWNQSKKKMILLGFCPINKKIVKYLTVLSSNPSIVIFVENISHVRGAMFFSNIDQLISGMNLHYWIHLMKPEILLTIGGNLISKKIKSILKKSPPKFHWHLEEKNDNYPDNYYRLNTFWPIKPELFLKFFSRNDKHLFSYYKKEWNKIQKKKNKKLECFFKKEQSFSDLTVFSLIFPKIPNRSILQLGNSMVIRYYQLFIDKNSSIQCYCNRGTSGIEGSVSTAIGCSVISKQRVTLIIGDISFFYDSNALWNNYIPNNFRIILINNGGGNIFRFVSKKKLPKKVFNFFETKHDMTAKKICEMYQWKYKQVSNFKELKKILKIFWKNYDSPFLLEIHTNGKENEKVFRKFCSYLSL
ncbi:2-succinyl-5-enolpyruvyl-6-hydroxy-3-cyclohexene-1-carboxylic-acid synthase [Blattabacterium cuenoti]|uniref:2-succinyl-5-enolpyruvyl-6-hydroxy-3- cyclohexene-1-carboxylic-acid synthase n=1 Tax=Blattabacterium cuenoti TaxID=1653831 RepID=UPI00163BF564|nr:2-succinyl-5-enolpyruvyl-6-hydroxy-3-cyclohexene-1-carboxylic-acid synthase [Blattabacterium cuenoti]